jgi:hypothetical protein
MFIDNRDNMINTETLTVGKLKEILKDLPDETTIMSLKLMELGEIPNGSTVCGPIPFNFTEILYHEDIYNARDFGKDSDNTLVSRRIYFNIEPVEVYMTNENSMEKVIYDGRKKKDENK